MKESHKLNQYVDMDLLTNRLESLRFLSMDSLLLNRHGMPGLTRQRVGFLDLDTETRNRIFEYVLVNYAADGELHVVNIVDSPNRRAGGYQSSEYYISGSLKRGIFSSEDDMTRDEILRTPAIVSTWRFFKLASKSLRSAYIFFTVETCLELTSPGNVVQEDGPPTLGMAKARSLLPVLFDQSMPPLPPLPPLHEFTSTAFFRQIGPESTATIQHLELYGNFTVDFKVMQLLTEVLKHHAGFLKTMVFYLIAKDQDARAYDPEEYRADVLLDSLPHDDPRLYYPSRFSRGNTYDVHLPFDEVVGALKEVYEQLESLEVIQYRGNWRFGRHVRDNLPAQTPPGVILNT
jgi:hypothetical protein